MSGLADGWAELASQRLLAQLHVRIGMPGMAAAAGLPGLVAAMDQHAAAVRDILSFGVDGSATVAGPVLLAGYAKGLIDQAKELGWRFGTPPDWASADWVAARLLAICDLARRANEPIQDLAGLEPLL